MKIRLTESELKQIVEESVKNVLTELDWKTYANAARKDKDPKRSKRFASMAADKFDKEHRYVGDGGVTSMGQDMNLEHNYTSDDGIHNHFSTSLEPTFKDHPTNRYERIVNASSGQSYIKKPFTNSKAHARAMQKSQDAFNAYRTGKSKYVKGTGWDDSEHTPTDWHEYMDYNN